MNIISETNLTDGISKVEILIISPKIAAAMLTKANPLNRHESPAVIEKYAHDMRAGKWALNHQGIALGPDGTILDGHHRLKACVASGRQFRTLVVHYSSVEAYRAAMASVDRGRTRQQGHILELLAMVKRGQGLRAAAIVAAVAECWEGETSLSVEQTKLRFLQRAKSINWILKALAGERLPAPVMAALVVSHGYFPEQTEEFARLITSKVGLVKNSAAHCLVRTMERVRMSGSQAERTYAFRVVLRALAGHIRGEKMKRLQASDEGVNFFEDPTNLSLFTKKR